MEEQLATFASRFFDWGFYSADLTFIFCTVALLGRFDKRPRTLAFRFLDLAALLVIEALLCLVKYLVTGDLDSIPMLFTTLAGYALFQKRIRTTDKIVRCATFLAAFILLIGITGILAPALGFLRDIPYGSALPNIVSFAALLSVALFLQRFSISGFRYVPRSYANLVVSICLIASIAGWSFIQFNAAHHLANIEPQSASEVERVVLDMSSVNLAVDVGFLALVLISYRMFYLLSAEHDQRAERLVTKRSADDNAEMISITKSVYESIREIRHETRNRTAYMEALAESGDWERLSEYISSFMEQASGLLNYVQSGNSTVDAVVNAKIALANSQGIEVKTMLAVPQELGFAEEDLYALIANLMDNAIEGAVASNAIEKVIKLSIRPEGGYYIVTVQNPCAEHKDASGSLSRLRTTKTDKEAHGYGTKVISRIARRCNGTARYQIKGNVFTANVMLAQTDGEAVEEAG